MKKFEYKIIKNEGEKHFNLLEFLNKHGLDGWELIERRYTRVETEWQESGDCPYSSWEEIEFIFKREIIGE